MRFLALSLILLLGASCSSVEVSDQRPFSEYIDAVVETRRETALKSLNESLFLGGGVSFLKRPDNELLDVASGDSFSRLNSGTELEIQGVYQEVLIDGVSDVAYGKVKGGPFAGSEFAYRWGFLDVLNRAPWESEDVPERRERERL